MSGSDLSSLSSAESIESDDETRNAIARRGPIESYFKPNKSDGPPKKKRAPSPPHEYILADNPDIAFIVKFRARFSAVFPKSLPHFGPQDIEWGIADAAPGEHVEKLLCALLGLVLNRKKDVERGHYHRPLEEALQTHISQWPLAWDGKNPLHGGTNFHSMTPEQRLSLLKALILWSLNSSDAVQAFLKESYKQNRHEDDLNQPLSVQPWGRDGDKRRYWLIEGQDDTHFRLYRESNPALKHNTWWSVADSIDSVKAVADRLREENTQAGRRLSERIMGAVPRFEAGEEKRRRREYRIARKAQFRRPDPGFSLYEGRTRGKRIKYTFSDDEETSDAMSNRRSTRQSGISTPAEPAGPTYTASGRQVRPPTSGRYGEGIASTNHHGDELGSVPTGEMASDADGDNQQTRTRSGRASGQAARPNADRKRTHIDGYNALDEMEVESDAVSSENSWDGGGDDDEVADNATEDDDDEMSDEEDAEEAQDPSPKSLVVALRVGKERAASIPAIAARSSRAHSQNPETSVTANGTSPASSKQAASSRLNGIDPASGYTPDSSFQGKTPEVPVKSSAGTPQPFNSELAISDSAEMAVDS